MGKIKDLYMNLLEQNDNVLPPNITIGDLKRMNELQMLNWEEYDREQKKIRSEHNESKNSNEIAKIKQTENKFKNYFRNLDEEESE